MTVTELINRLEAHPGNLEVFLEVAGVGKDDRTAINDVQLALYDQQEVHLIAEDGVSR